MQLSGIFTAYTSSNSDIPICEVSNEVLDNSYEQFRLLLLGETNSIISDFGLSYMGIGDNSSALRRGNLDLNSRVGLPVSISQSYFSPSELNPSGLDIITVISEFDPSQLTHFRQGVDLGIFEDADIAYPHIQEVGVYWGGGPPYTLFSRATLDIDVVNEIGANDYLVLTYKLAIGAPRRGRRRG